MKSEHDRFSLDAVLVSSHPGSLCMREQLDQLIFNGNLIS